MTWMLSCDKCGVAEKEFRGIARPELPNGWKVYGIPHVIDGEVYREMSDSCPACAADTANDGLRG